jgi:hypothetical protein
VLFRLSFGVIQCAHEVSNLSDTYLSSRLTDFAGQSYYIGNVRSSSRRRRKVATKKKDQTHQNDASLTENAGVEQNDPVDMHIDNRNELTAGSEDDDDDNPVASPTSNLAVNNPNDSLAQSARSPRVDGDTISSGFDMEHLPLDVCERDQRPDVGTGQMDVAAAQAQDLLDLEPSRSASADINSRLSPIDFSVFEGRCIHEMDSKR